MTSSPRSRAGWGSISHERRAVSAYTGSHARPSTNLSLRKELPVAPTGSGKTVVPVASGQDRKELHK